MKNITITLDDRTAAWARREAARRNLSVSRLIGQVLQEHIQEARQYQAAMRHYLALEPVPLGEPGERYLNRDEVHDRSRLR